MTEFTARMQAFLGKAVTPPAIDVEGASGAHYEGVIHVVPMVHRPTAGWAGVPDNVIAYVRQSQEELVECLEHLAARETIVVIAEGFNGTIDSARLAASAHTDAELLEAADGYGIAEFIVKSPHVPVIGGDLPHDFHTLHEQILRVSTQMPGARPVFNVLQEFRNRYAVQVALHAARSLGRTPVLVFGLDHAEGIAHAARKVAADVRLTLVPTVAVQCEHLFEPNTPLRQQQ